MITTDSPDFDGVPLDTKTIPQEQLNIENKRRSNLFPWNGQFSPQLVEVLLRTYSHGTILDPFLGSGTVLNEAGRLGFPAFGSEINPAAFTMARVYSFINVIAPEKRRAIEGVADAIEDCLPAEPSLFSNADSTDLTVETALTDLVTAR